MVSIPKLLALLFVAALAAGCASPTTPTPTTGATPTSPTQGGGQTFTVGTDAAFPPFEELAENGSFEGFDIDVMQEIARRNGWTITFQNLVFDTLIPSLRSGEIHFAISAMSINENRSQIVDFSIPYYEANQSVTQLASDTRTFTSLDDLRNASLTFGAQSGTVAVDIIEAELPDAELRRYDTYPLAVQAMKAGEVDVVMMDAPAQKEAAADDPAIKVAFEFSVGDVYGIAMPKGSAHLNAVNDALEAMQDDGTLASLREKWGL